MANATRCNDRTVVLSASQNSSIFVWFGHPEMPQLKLMAPRRCHVSGPYSGLYAEVAGQPTAASMCGVAETPLRLALARRCRQRAGGTSETPISSQPACGFRIRRCIYSLRRRAFHAPGTRARDTQFRRLRPHNKPSRQRYDARFASTDGNGDCRLQSAGGPGLTATFRCGSRGG